MEFLLVIIILMLFLLFEIVVIHGGCKKKIYKQINVLGGSVVKIERLSLRETNYCVYYILDEKYEKVIVRFNVLTEDKWEW
jgi:hypothetical protein